ncbi:MAG: CTP synthase [Clostridiales bacterium]|jgi:CTP synthase|nr:CTP synthase [Clostridiales bacterium]
MPTKYIFVTGGVVSGLGKGITAAALGRLLKARGVKVTIQKFDPYINIDPGTMSPYQHGEVYVTEDGGETDLDIGHYERFIDENLTKNANTTTGKIYWSLLNKERRGDFLGATIQVVPHVTNAIKDAVYRAAKERPIDVVITEIGGTVGDIESLPFLEAIRQLMFEVGRENVLYIHVTLIPFLSKSGEMKTKPTQHSVKELLSIGIQPDIIVCRTENPMPPEMRAKIGMFCNVPGECVVQNIDSESLYAVPLLLEEENLARVVCERLALSLGEPDLTEWRALVARQKAITRSVRVALVGKYVALHDAYLSVVEALKHGGIENAADAEIIWIDAEDIEKGADMDELFAGADGIIAPGGFGERGVEGIIAGAGYARTRGIPYLGICLGMQCAVIEFARNVLGLTDAHTAEFAPESSACVIDLMPEQKDVQELGGTMRLGSYPCVVAKGTLVSEAYSGAEIVYERHRHRYEFNNQFRDAFTDAGLVISGLSPDQRLIETVELPRGTHPWFVGVQFHPEMKSRPNRAQPLFKEFIAAASGGNKPETRD